jgi:hypothetical protein
MEIEATRSVRQAEVRSASICRRPTRFVIQKSILSVADAESADPSVMTVFDTSEHTAGPCLGLT